MKSRSVNVSTLQEVQLFSSVAKVLIILISVRPLLSAFYFFRVVEYHRANSVRTRRSAGIIPHFHVTVTFRAREWKRRVNGTSGVKVTSAAVTKWLSIYVSVGSSRRDPAASELGFNLDRRSMERRTHSERIAIQLGHGG